MIDQARSALTPRPVPRAEDRLRLSARRAHDRHGTDSVTMPIAAHEHGCRLLGDEVRIVVGSSTWSAGEQETFDRALRRIQAVDEALSQLDRNSELSLLNGHAGEWVRVSAVILDAVEAAVTAAEISGGLVDPTLMRMLERAGYAPRRHQTPALLARALARPLVRSPAAPRAAGEWRRIQIDRQRSAVRLPRGVRIDLAGSAKAMAVDAVAATLAHLPSVVIDIGGDIRLAGIRPAPVSAAVAHPLVGGDALRVTIRAGAIATSGLATGVWATGCGFAHHLVDPACAAPAWTGVIQATALAPTMLEAATLAKLAFLRGPHASGAVLERHGGIITLDNGRSITIGELDVLHSERDDQPLHQTRTGAHDPPTSRCHVRAGSRGWIGRSTREAVYS